MNSYPLISCICIAEGKPNSLKQAINCFNSQNYPNRELVIGYSKGDQTSRHSLENTVGNEDFKLITFSYFARQTEEEIIKQAIIKSTGAYVCIWNEEDWHHESRISYQFNSMQLVGERFQASSLTKFWIYDYLSGKSYLSATKLWKQTTLFKKDIYLESVSQKTNDLTQLDFVNLLFAKKMLFSIDGAPFLYIKSYHDGDSVIDLDEQCKQKLIALLK